MSKVTNFLVDGIVNINIKHRIPCSAVTLIIEMN